MVERSFAEVRDMFDRSEPVVVGSDVFTFAPRMGVVVVEFGAHDMCVSRVEAFEMMREAGVFGADRMPDASEMV